MANVTKLKEEKRVKPIVLTDNDTGEKYTLEFSRQTVAFAEGKGFVMDDIAKYPLTKIPELFYYAFRMHHRNVPRDKTDKIIFEDWGGIANIPDGVLERLGELYAATYGALVDDEGERKNLRVTVEL